MIGDKGNRVEEAKKAEQRRAPSESSAPREQEPNDFPAQATLLELGGDLRPVKGTLSSPTDHDWFALTSRNGESWQVELTVTPTTPTLDLMVLVEVPGAPGAPTEYHITGAGEPEVIPILAVSEQPQRILIQSAPDGTSGDYEISFKKRLAGGAIEAEPNDEVDAATAFEAPGLIEGFYDRPNDRDIFYVAPSRLDGSLVSLQVTPIDGIVQTLQLFTSRDLQTPYLSMQIPPDRSAGIPNLRVPQGALGLWVVMTAGEKFNRQKSYQLQLLAHPPVDKALEEEPNDAAASAQQIKVGTALSGYFHTPEDVDYFRVYVGTIPSADAPAVEEKPAEEPTPEVGEGETGEPGAEEDEEVGETAQPVDPLAAVADKDPIKHLLRVTAKPTREDARIGLAVQGSSDVLTSQPGAEAILCNRVVEEGGYLELSLRPAEYPEAGLQQDFDYELVTEDLAKIEGIEVEPNDATGQADKLLEGQKRVGFVASAQDVDVYAFAVPFPAPTPEPEASDSEEGQAPELDLFGNPRGAKPSAPAAPAFETRKVSLRLAPNPANLAFKLRDDEGGLVAQVNRAGAGGEERLTMDLPSGLYFVHVSGTHTNSCEPYELTFDLLP